MKDINLDNPIFAYYIDVSSHTIQLVDQIRNTFPSNVTIWIVPSNYDKIECIFDGWKMKSASLRKVYALIEEINVDDPNLLKSLTELKSQIRELIIDDVVN